MYDSQKKVLLPDKPPVFKNKSAVDNAIIDCIIEDGRPFNDFRKAGMRRVLDVLAPGYKAPHRKTVAKQMRIRYYEYKNTLKNRLSRVSDIALATDLWKNRNGSYWCSLTAHFLTKNFFYKTKVVCFRRFYGRQLSDRLEAFVRKEIVKLGITDKVRSITTDNAADITKAMRAISLQLSCFCHNLNLVLNQSMKLWAKPEQSPQSLDDILAQEDNIYYDNFDENEIESIESEDEDTENLSENEYDVNDSSADEKDDQEVASQTSTENPDTNSNTDADNADNSKLNK